MGTETTIRGSHVGAGPAGEPDHGITAPRTHVSFWCVNRHETRPGFAAGAPIPATWVCLSCGNPAGRDPRHPPVPPHGGSSRTHLERVKERRSTADLEALLEWARGRLPWAGSGQPGSGAGQRKAQARADPGAAGGDQQRAQGIPVGQEGRRGTAGRRQRAHGSAPSATSAGCPVRRADPAPPPAPAGEWCTDGCGYKLDSRSHKGICLGQW